MATSDPWDWNVDEVVNFLCSPDGALFERFAGRLDFKTFESTLRDNDINGEDLLTEFSLELLEKTFGIESFGQRTAIKRQIARLRETSIGYKRSGAVQDYIKSEHDSRSVTAALKGTPAPSLVSAALVHGSSIPSTDLSGAPFQARTKQPEAISFATSSSFPPQNEALVQKLNVNLSTDDHEDTSDQPPTKKRRVAPQSILQLDDLSLLDGPSAQQVSEITGISISKDEGTGVHNAASFLGRQSIPVTELFYGDTDLDKEFTLSVNLVEQEKKALARRLLTEATEGTVFHLDNSTTSSTPGKTLYLNTRMKYFLLQSNPANPKLWTRKVPDVNRGSFGSRDVRDGVKPYPSRLLDPGTMLRTITKNKEQQEQSRIAKSLLGNRQVESLTICRSGKTFRVPASVWEQFAWEDFDLPNEEELIDEYKPDYLDKWTGIDEEPLPIWNKAEEEESISTDSDSDQLSEMEAKSDMEEDFEQTGYLRPEQITAVIEEEREAYLKNWESKVLPSLESKAWSLWNKSRNTLQIDMQHWMKKANEYSSLLVRIESTIIQDTKWKEAQLREQCSSMQSTIEHMAAAEWKCG